jgi:hypothetical protein
MEHGVRCEVAQAGTGPVSAKFWYCDTRLWALLVSVTLLLANAEAQVAKRRFAIPAGSLASVLNRFADAADLQLVYDTALAAGLRSPGVSGTYTSEQALQPGDRGSGHPGTARHLPQC